VSTTPAANGSPSIFVRVARWCSTHRLRTFLGFLVALIAFQAIGSAVGKKELASFRLPNTESQRAYDLLAEHFPAQKGDVDQFVFKAKSGTLESQKTTIDQTVAKLEKAKGVAAVQSPFQQGGQLSKDGRIGVVQVTYKDTLKDNDLDMAKHVEKVGFAARADKDLQVEHGGVGAQFVRQSSAGGPSEFVGILAAAVVLFLVFGSLFAMGIPLLSTLLAMGTTLGAITLMSHVVDTPDFASQLATLIGLGVGIDYSLFVISRYRSEVKAGMDRARAVELAVDTAGRTVVFAAITVVIALLGLFALGLNFMHGVAVGASFAVLATMFSALTLIPALIGGAGEKMDGLTAKRRAAYARKHGEGTRWAAWSRAVQRRPYVAAAVGLILLLGMALPVTGMRLGSSDASLDPKDSTTHNAYDLIAQGFGPGTNAQFLIVAELPKKGDVAPAQQLAAAVKRDRDFVSVGRPAVSPDGTVATITAYPKTGPQDEATEHTLDRLRGDVVPAVEQQTGVRVEVGGLAAGNEDFTKVVADKLPFFVGIVVLLSALLLLVVFRSVFIPIKAAAMNLLSIGASLGFVTLVFQEGLGADLLNVGEGPIESFVPVMFFAIVFGLSMDYEVFLISRVHEEWEKTGDAEGAVATGLQYTGKIITAAAAIMILVFASFGLGDDRVIKMFGLGLASAIFFDAVIIRCLLVPALMEIAGKHAWWLPSWLDRRMPRLAIERETPGQAVLDPT
jgi:RND superfamily putative drug exporter